MEPLMNASREGNIDGLYAAIQENPHILSIIDEIPFVETPLHIATSAGHIHFAMEIMRLKPSFANKSNTDGFSPIHIAIQKNNTQMVLCFVEMDPGLVRVKGREGITPLHLVVRAGNIHLLQRFLSACPQSVEDVTVRYETALHMALKCCKLDAFQVLLDMLHRDSNNEETYSWKKRVLNCRDSEGNTLLHISTLRNQFQVTEKLVAYDKSNPGMLQVNAKNERNQTAMDIALLFQNLHIQRLLGQMTPNETVTNPILKTNQKQNSETQDTNLPREEIYKWENYFKFDMGKSSPEKTRSDLLVVAVLMATATYQAVLSPPGGADDETGIALLGEDGFSYAWFMFFNSAGFFVSLHIIMVLMYNYPMFWELYVAIVAMGATYDAAMISITPLGNMRLFFLVLSIVMPMLIPVVAFRLRKYIKKRKQRKGLIAFVNHA